MVGDVAVDVGGSDGGDAFDDASDTSALRRIFFPILDKPAKTGFVYVTAVVDACDEVCR